MTDLMDIFVDANTMKNMSDYKLTTTDVTKHLLSANHVNVGHGARPEINTGTN